MDMTTYGLDVAKRVFLLMSAHRGRRAVPFLTIAPRKVSTSMTPRSRGLGTCLEPPSGGLETHIIETLVGKLWSQR